MGDYNGNGSNGAASPFVDNAKEQTTQVLQQGQQAASDLAGKALTQVKTTIGAQKDNLAQTVGGVADALNHAGDKLRESGGDTVAGYASSAADQIKGVSQFLSDRNVDELIQETNAFARSKPVVFLSAALVLGIAAARFLKSSSQAATTGSGGTTALVPATSDWLPQEPNLGTYEARPNYAVEPTVA